MRLMLNHGFLFSASIGILMINIVALERISEKKCRDYAELVYANESVPVLRIGGGSRIVSKCRIIETPLIVGGIKAKLMEFPHQTIIGYGHEIHWQCGGSIISESFILTAAHCVSPRGRGAASRIRVGIISLESPDTETMQERNIFQSIKHPDYRLLSKYNDVALLKLDKPLELNAAVRPACLEVNPIMTGERFIASGFGKTNYDALNGSNDLLKVTLDYIDSAACENVFEHEIGTRQMRDGLLASQICAGVMSGGKDTCQGDSGGPLQRVLPDPYCMYSIVGITSFGKFCAFKNSPAIYTRVSYYLDWIEKIVWPND